MQLFRKGRTFRSSLVKFSGRPWSSLTSWSRSSGCSHRAQVTYVSVFDVVLLVSAVSIESRWSIQGGRLIRTRCLL